MKSKYGKMQKLIFSICTGLFVFLTFVLLLIVIGSFSTFTERMLSDGVLRTLVSVTIAMYIVGFFLIQLMILNSQNKRLRTGNRVFLFLGILVLQYIFLTKLGKLDLTTDSFRVIDMAAEMVNSKQPLIKNAATDTVIDAYFSKYGNNHFIVLFFYFFFKIVKWFGGTDFPFWARILNLVFIDLGIVLTYKLAKKIVGQKYGDLVLCFAFLCSNTYVWLFWTYTNTISVPFTMGVLLLSFLWQKEEKRWKQVVLAIAMGILSAFGYRIRPTVIITVIALCIWHVFFTDKEEGKEKVKKIGVWLGLFLSFFVICTAGLGQFTKQYLEDKECKGEFPITHWIMLGLSDDGRYNFDDVDYTTAYATKEEKQKANIKEIKRRIKSRDAKETLIWAGGKLYTVFGDGTDQYTQQNTYQENQTRQTEYVYGRKNTLFKMYCRVFRLLEIFLVFVGIVETIRKKEKKWFLYQLNYLGAMLFFLIWEANKKYSISFDGILFLLSAQGILYIEQFFHRLKGKVAGYEKIDKSTTDMPVKRTKAGRNIVQYGTTIFFVATFLVTTVVYFYGKQGFVKNTYEMEKKAVAIRSGKCDGINELEPDYTELEQNIETRLTFGKILFRTMEPCKKGKGSGYYTIQIIDEQKQVLVKKKIEPDSEELGEKGITISFPKIVTPDDNVHSYKLKITRSSKETDFLDFKIYCYQAVDRYRSGDLSVDGKTEGMRDMALTAYQREMEAEISEGVYHRIFLFADGIVILCACVCAWSTYRTKKELLESA